MIIRFILINCIFGYLLNRQLDLSGEIKLYDVIIIGSGMFGSSLAAVLARNEAKVLLIDAGKHPRFAVGESTVRDTSKLLKILSQRFDVPELGNISSFVEINEKVSSHCGLKRNFGFVYHRSQQKQEPQEVYQIVIPDHFEGPEIHFFRQEIDHYLCQVAQKYGATVLEETRIEEINITSKEVTVETNSKEQFKASYIVDATGYRSVLAEKFNLREETCRFKTHSRSIFTHMKGVKPYEECSSGKIPKVPRKWSQGTLHHCFDGGWIWVIPFNNTPDAKNPLISVGLQLDSRKYPFTDINPETEWNSIISKFPSIAEQFEQATPVKPWISTGSRLQYSSSQTVGERYCLAAHAAGFIEPLYSRGLPLSLNSLLLLADKLLLAIADEDFSTERFKDVESYQQQALDNIDALVAGSYTSWGSYELWNAWVRIWYACANLSTLHLQASYESYLQNHNPKILTEAYSPNWGSFCPSLDSFQPFFTQAVEIIDAVETGKMSSETATSKLFFLIQNADFLPPVFNLEKPEINNGGSFDVNHLRSLADWGNQLAPQEVKQKLFSGDAEENLRRLEEEFEAFECSDNYSSVRVLLNNL